MLELEITNKFKRDWDKLKKRGYDTTLLRELVKLLREGKPLPPKYKDHPLQGARSGYRDCHIKDDWVLIYKIDKNKLILILVETGTHSDVFKD